MLEHAHYRVSVKGIVIDETGRFLLAKEADGRWEMLGGGLDHGEDPIAGLRREIYEETGLEVTYISDTPKYFITAKKVAHPGYTANVIYEVKLKNLDFTASDECQELQFFSVEEAKQVPLFPNVEKLLQVYNPTFHL